MKRQIFDFARIVLPELFNLGADLFDHFKGDSNGGKAGIAAAREITRIRDHLKTLRDADAANRRELDELEKK